jgi:hemoglobin-like flavoprotein
VKAHALLVIRTIGQCVSGETSLERVVPYLRSIGEKHEIVGVQDSYYEVINRNLLQVIADELGPKKWDEEMYDAWEMSFHSITSEHHKESTQISPT